MQVFPKSKDKVTKLIAEEEQMLRIKEEARKGREQSCYSVSNCKETNQMKRKIVVLSEERGEVPI